MRIASQPQPFAPTPTAGGFIGVMDSGVGGLSVLKHLVAQLPHEDFVYVADSAHAPYGNKTTEAIRARCFAIAELLLAHGAKALVVACNTATAAAIADMRARYTLPIIGMEPAVKPAAAATRNGVIGVLATSGTLQSAQFAALLESYGREVRVVTQACHGLVECIERGALDAPETQALVDRYCQALLAHGADTLVLGCTHYPLVRPLIAKAVGPQVQLIDTGAAVAKRLADVLASQQLLQPYTDTVTIPPDRIRIYTNNPQPDALVILQQLWQQPAQFKRLVD